MSPVLVLETLELVKIVKFEELASRVEPPQGLIRSEWNQHKNPDGSLGGWVQNTAHVDPSVFLALGAVVTDMAKVREHAKILDTAHIGGWAVISGQATVSDDATVIDAAQVSGDCILKGTVMVRGDSVLTSGTFSEGDIKATTHTKKSSKPGFSAPGR